MNSRAATAVLLVHRKVTSELKQDFCGTIGFKTVVLKLWHKLLQAIELGSFYIVDRTWETDKD